MKKKILTTILLIILLFQALMPLNTYATVEYVKKEVISMPAKIEYQKADDGDMELYAGIVLEPTVEFLTLLVDAVMSCITAFMRGESIKFVMVSNIHSISDFGTAGTTYTITDLSDYRKTKYPNFTYSPEEIFAGKIDFLDANFMNNSNSNPSWNLIRKTVSHWYKVLRMIAIIGLLSLLIFTGIKIILASTSSDKAKYKELILNWIIACVLVFTLHYIMSFIMNVTEEITSLINASGTIEVQAGTKGTFKTNLIGLIRFQLQQRNFTPQLVYLILYICLAVYTVKFTFIYLKRVLIIAFLTMIAPIVAFMYPIDKLDGNATNFNMWFKEYLFNALLAPVHYLLFKVLISSSITLAASNPIFALAAMSFISQGEKLLKSIFGFDKAKEGTVGGLAGAITGAAMVSGATKLAKNALGASRGGSRSSNGGGSLGGGSGNPGSRISTDESGWLQGYDQDEMLNEFIDPEQTTQDLQLLEMPEDNLLEEDLNFGNIEDYRQSLSDTNLGELNFNDGDSRSMEDLLGEYSKLQMDLKNPNNSPEQIEAIRQQMLGIESLLQNRVLANEFAFSDMGISPQYIDGEDMSSIDLLNYAMRNSEKAQASYYSMDEREYYQDKAESAMNTLNRRMLENQYMQQETTSNISEDINSEDNGTRFTRGMAAVLKAGFNPIWDVDKSKAYNGKRLARNIGKGAVTALKVGGAVTVGGAATILQAGISMSDGKYNPLEGVATFTAGAVGTSKLIDSVGNKITNKAGGVVDTYKQEAMAGDEQAQMKEYAKDWYDRDDVIKNYEREFPGNGKEMRKRAQENLVSKGITNFEEQKQVLKFAELIRTERGLSQEESDKIAVATLQYKQNLIGNSNYGIIYDSKKREGYIDSQIEAYTGSASKESIRKLHNDFIQNIRDFDRANR